MRVQFGTFVLDPETRELLRAGRAVPLSPKAFDLLRLLVANRPKAMTKSELLEYLWPDTFVVEKNLANLIGEIRDALGEDSSNPRFIRTIHRFGYAFREISSRSDHERPPNRLDDALFLVKWVNGRARIGAGEYVLGRDPDVEILLNHAGVSRRHALIRIAADGATIEDLGSKNGTFVGERLLVKAGPLADGDIIRVGSVELTFSALQMPTSTETVAGRRFPLP
jgi:DNA-binding winged helix-turn-helix (wHTH) protein